MFRIRWSGAGTILLLIASIAAGIQLLIYRAEMGASAQFVGSFPDNMPAVNALLTRTRDKLFIMNDFCEYGHYSNDSEYRVYKKTLQDLRHKGLWIEVHVYSPVVASKMTALQLGLSDPNTAEAVFEGIIAKSDKYLKYLQAAKTEHPGFADPKDYTQFLDLLASDEANCINDLRAAGVNISRDVSETLPLFVWIRDESDEAIFSVYNLGHDSREVSQDTKNRQIILMLKDIATKIIQGK